MIHRASGQKNEDLGRFYCKSDLIPSEDPPMPGSAAQHPSKFVVYEQYLRVPHYLTYNRKTQQLRYFQLLGGQYQEQPLAHSAPLIWLA